MTFFFEIGTKFFYTNIVGFAPIIVSGIMLLARVWDAINDPMMGSIAENTRSKFGRFRPYIAFGIRERLRNKEHKAEDAE